MQKRTKRKAYKIQPLVIGLAVVIVAVVIGVVLVQWIGGGSRQKVDLDSFLGIADKERDAAIYLQDELSDSKAYIDKGQYYFELKFLQEHIDERFYFDERENVLIFTTPTEIIKAFVGSPDYYVTKQKNSLSHDIVKTDGVNVYVSVEFAKMYADFSYETVSSPNRIVVKNVWGPVTYAALSKKAVVRTDMDKKSDVIVELPKESRVRVIESYGTWSEIQTEDGYIGFVVNRCLGKTTAGELKSDYVAPVYTSIAKDYTIQMVWHNVTNYDANDSLVDRTAGTKGITTVSPTWFSVANANGDLDSLASSNYVTRAHHLGYEVWALLNDFTSNDKGVHYAAEAISYTSRRENLINQLIAEVISYNIDGINIDFEYVASDDAEHFIQFLRELSVKCRINGIVLSVDNYVPASYNLYYDRTEQGILADYVIIMGYDEHNGASTEAGPVASKGFVEKAVVDTLAEVPANKVILGAPFYTRVWYEMSPEDAPEDAVIVEDPIKGDYALDTYAYDMEGAEELLADADGHKVWLDEMGCNYAEFESEEGLCRIWFEDEASMEVKMKLMKQYELSGAAFWALGQEKSSIWDTIIKYTN